jgi:hypothetical protein
MSRSPETHRDLLSAAGLAVLAGAYLVANRSYPLDTLATPGPGIFPLAVGLLMLGLAAAQAVAALRSGPPQAPVPQAESDAEATVGGHAIAMAVVLVAYAAAAGVIGFLTASFAAILVSSRLLGARDWLRPVLLALGVTFVAHVIFVAWLGVPFPTGLLR